MKVTFEIWQLITLLIMAAGLFTTLGKLLLTQFQRSLETRLAEMSRGAQSLEDRLAEIARDAKGYQNVERDLLQLKAELPERYVRREDYIRGQTVLEAKLDRVFTELEFVKIQGARRES